MTAGGFDGVERRGLMFVLSSPSGAGKSTLSRMLIERMSGLKMSVSATTRPMRPGEVDGRDYFFVDKPKFEAMVKKRELLEWATVFDNRYGTPRARVATARATARRPGLEATCGRTGRAVRYRLAGHPAIARESPRRRRQRVHPAAVGGRPREAAAHPCPGFGRGDSRPHEP